MVERKQLSSTTIELSTIMPTPSTKLLRVITFRENPMALMEIRAARMEMGIDVPTIRDAFRSPKNRKIITMDTTIAIIMVCITEFKEDLIMSLLSLTTTISKLGSPDSSLFMVRITSFDTCTSVLLCCFLISMAMVSLPL